jgi:uncharacterized protein YPO0396
MADNNQRTDNQEVGYGKTEAVAGLAAGTTAAHFTGKSFAKVPVDTLPDAIAEAGKKAEELFHTNNAGMAAEELAAGVQTAVKAAKEPLQKEFANLSNPLTRPYTAFKGASTMGKIGMGAAVAASALGAAWVINAVRNIGKEPKSHADQLEAERNGQGGHQR